MEKYLASLTDEDKKLIEEDQKRIARVVEKCNTYTLILGRSVEYCEGVNNTVDKIREFLLVGMDYTTGIMGV